MYNNRMLYPLLGPNGCGKGTTGDFLAGLGAHVETTSDILEEYKIKNPNVAQEIKQYKEVLNRNVPDGIVFEAVTRKLRKVFRQKHQGLFVVDGYGREGPQMEMLAEWVETRNADYIKKGRPLITHGYVFLTLGFEESMERVRKRVEDCRKKGIEPRPEDLGEKPKDRYKAYEEKEAVLIDTAKRVTGNVTILELGMYTTVEVASHILGMTTGISSDQFATKIREKFELAS